MHCINVYCSWSTGSNNARAERLCVCVCVWTGLTGRPTAAGGKRLWKKFAVTPKKVKEPIRLTAE